MNKNIGRFVCAAALAAVAWDAQAGAVDISNGAYAQILVRNCSLNQSPGGGCNEVNGPSFDGTQVAFDFNRRPGGSSASIATDHPLGISSHGTTQASVEVFDANTRAPLARQGGFANGAAARVSGVTDSVSGYAFTPFFEAGDPQAHIALSLDYFGTNVTGHLTGNPLGGNVPASSLQAVMYVFSLSTPIFRVDDGTGAPTGDCVFGITIGGFIQLVNDCLSGQRSDYRLETWQEILSVPGLDETPMTIEGTVDFTPVEGRYYFLELFTGAWGKYDSYMNALGTVETRFVDASGQTIDPAAAGFTALPMGAAAVPEPSTVALIASSLAALAGFRAPRRRKH